MAAVAVTGGAMAQATMTGAVAVAYSSDTTVAGANTSGFGTGDSEINFGVTENIEGLGTLSAGLGFGGGGNGTTVKSNDTTLALKLASGTALKFYGGKAGHYLAGGNASAGGSFEIGLDGYLLSSRSAKDEVSISVPLVDGVSISFAHAEYEISSAGTGAAGAGNQRTNTISLKYNSGALAADAGYRSYDGQTSDTTTSASNKSRASASYDLGVAKFGVGYDQTSYTANNSYQETLTGVTVPLGNLTLSAQYGTVATSGYSTNYSFNGSLVGAKYDLSKRTYLTAQYASWNGSFKASTATATSGTQNANTLYISLYNTF